MAEIDRRKILAGAAAAGALVSLPVSVGASTAAFAAPAAALPAGFPIASYLETFQNWSKAVTAPDLWTCAPKNPDEVVAVANWAKANGYRVRARGMRHNWSPLVVTNGGSEKTIIVDTTKHLTGVQIAGGKAVVAAGTTMDALLDVLGNAGLGLTAVPAPGGITVAGALAIGAHGCAIPAVGETRVPGTTYGSLSNLITSFTAVVWDGSAYALKTFARTDADATAFFTHVGRAFLTSVTLSVGTDVNLRCVSRVDVSADELFAKPGTGGRTFQSFVEKTGRISTIWFPFTDRPWLRTWQIAPSKPFLSRKVTAPYNQPFAENLPENVTDCAAKIITGNAWLTPTFGKLEYDAIVAGLTTSWTFDIWGASRNTLLYVRHSTLRVTALGYAIHTTRANIQRVVHEFTKKYVAMRDAYRAQGKYPMNGPLEIRVTGVDVPGDVGSDVAPALSPAAPIPGFDTIVWFDVITFPGTPHAAEFYTEIESWIHSNYTGWAAARAEWSKGWAFENSGGWSNPTHLGSTIPDSYPKWGWAKDRLNAYDPHRVFSNELLDKIL